MLIEHVADDVVVWAPAKVNLYLEVLGKRPDGYHEIDTVMVAVSLYDTLVFKEASSGVLAFRCDHAGLSAAADNLVLRAARLLQQQTGCPRGVQIQLAKRIPLAAGLAGGSTDAAATLAGLNRLWRLGLSVSDLGALGTQLGSDIAFFFATPAARCTGRGEHVTPMPLPRPLFLVLLCPAVGLATGDVYRSVKVPAQPQTGEALREALRQGDVVRVGHLLHNRLQAAAESLCPAIADYQARLAALQPAGQMMSGSGSSLFALCRDHRQALEIAAALRGGPREADSPRVYAVRSCVQGRDAPAPT